jgi:hypothetical protein
MLVRVLDVSAPERGERSCVRCVQLDCPGRSWRRPLDHAIGQRADRVVVTATGGEEGLAEP